VKAFRYLTTAGSYWTVIDDLGDYSEVPAADGYLRYLRFSRGKTEGTTSRYASSLALYFTYVERRGRDWREPDMTAFQMWLRVTPGPNETRRSRLVHAGPGAAPLRSDNTVDNICVAVCEMFKWAVAEGLVDSALLNNLYETSTTAHLPALARGEGREVQVLLRRRHQLERKRRKGSALPSKTLVELFHACRNSRDRLLVVTFGLLGLRRGEALGLRLADVHLLADSRVLGCNTEGPHVHVTPRLNSNRAAAKSGAREVPAPELFVLAYDAYRAARDAVPAAAASDYVFVNLWRHPLGEPMKLHAVNEMFERLGVAISKPVHPHMLRHTFGTNTAAVANLDVVQVLMGHAHITTSQTYIHPNYERQRAAVEAGALSLSVGGTVLPDGRQ
jgi:integrase/recombinase XerD